MNNKKNGCDKDNHILRSAFDSMFHYTEEVIAIFDGDLKIVCSNEPFRDLAKKYSVSLKYGNMSDIISDASLLGRFTSVMDDNVMSTETVLKSLNEKEPCILNVKLGPVREKGTIIGGYAIFVDITDFRKRESQLNKRFNLICRLVENANLGIVIIGQDHKVIEANQRFCEMTGYSQNEITGLHTWDWEYAMDQKDIKSNFSDLSEVHSSFETIHKRKDGTTYHAMVSASGHDVSGEGDDVIMCICQDISEKKETEEKLRNSEKKYRTYIENAADMILTVDGKGIITYVSPNCERICGFAPEELISRKVFDVFIHCENASDDKKGEKIRPLSDETSGDITMKLKHRDGSVHWYGITLSSTLDADGDLLTICNTRNIDERMEKEMKLRQMSLYDHLTAVPNKAFFDAMLERMQSNGQRPLTLLVCDMDRLKSINDMHGHASGDEALKVTAKLIQSSLRKVDFLARIGGDEFAVILPSTGQHEAEIIVGRIYDTFAEHNAQIDSLPVNISVGFSTVEETGTSLKKALNDADMDMYLRKSINRSKSQL